MAGMVDQSSRFQFVTYKKKHYSNIAFLTALGIVPLSCFAINFLSIFNKNTCIQYNFCISYITSRQVIYFNVFNRYFTCHLIKQLNLNKRIHYDHSDNSIYQGFYFKRGFQ